MLSIHVIKYVCTFTDITFEEKTLIRNVALMCLQVNVTIASNFVVAVVVVVCVQKCRHIYRLLQAIMLGPLCNDKR